MPLPLFAIPLAAGVSVTVLVGGGFSSGSRGALIVLAGAAVATAALTDAGLLAEAFRKPLVIALVGLGLLAMISAAWTIGRPADSVRWGFVVLAYAATLACAFALTVRSGLAPVAVGLVVLAGIEAAIGLGAAALHALPNAERIGGSWRPGGTFEYPPALALLQVFALAPLLTWMAGSRGEAMAAAVGAVLAGAVVGSAGSRLDLVLAAGVLAIGIVRPPSGAIGRGDFVAAAALVAFAAAGAAVMVRQHVPPRAESGGLARLLVTLAFCGALAAAWLPVRRRVRSLRRPARYGPTVAACAAVLVLVLLTAGAALSTRGSGGAAGRRGGVAHGRVREWEAAARTWLDRPALGAGAGAYYPASLTHQGRGPVLFAHDLPLELAAELGVVGLALGLALYGAGGHALWSARGSRALWLFGPAVVGFLLANLVDWTWHLAGLGAVWACAAGGLLADGGRGR